MKVKETTIREYSQQREIKRLEKELNWHVKAVWWMIAITLLTWAVCVFTFILNVTSMMVCGE